MQQHRSVGNKLVGEVFRSFTTMQQPCCPSLPILYASFIAGGEINNEKNPARSGVEFDAGREVALDLPTSNGANGSFFKKRELQNQLFIAAATSNDEDGEFHTIQIKPVDGILSAHNPIF